MTTSRAGGAERFDEVGKLMVSSGLGSDRDEGSGGS
jgi:hypothetical protein